MSSLIYFENHMPVSESDIETTITMDRKNLTSFMYSSVDNPVRGFILMELVDNLRRISKPENINNFWTHDTGSIDKKNSHWNQIQKVLSFLTLLIFKMKINPATNFDTDYLHILNLNHINY